MTFSRRVDGEKTKFMTLSLSLENKKEINEWMILSLGAKYSKNDDCVRVSRAGKRKHCFTHACLHVTDTRRGTVYKKKKKIARYSRERFRFFLSLFRFIQFLETSERRKSKYSTCVVYAKRQNARDRCYV